MKNINKIIVTLAVFLTFISLSCVTSTDHISVRIPVKNKKAVDFKKPRALLYSELKLEDLPKNYDPQQQVEDFFFKDLPKYIKRDVEPLHENTDKSGSLLISGKMKFDINDRNIIRKVKSEAGKKKKKFVSIQHWSMNFEVIITEADTGKELFKKNYESKLKDADPESTDYNFKALFNKVTDNFLKDITKKERFEQRYLLLR
jgi:hypothetical protein